MIGRRTKATFSVYFAAMSVAVVARCCEACRDDENYFRSGFLADSRGCRRLMGIRLPLTEN
jgi:hypothetical protein